MRCAKNAIEVIIFKEGKVKSITLNLNENNNERTHWLDQTSQKELLFSKLLNAIHMYFFNIDSHPIMIRIPSGAHPSDHTPQSECTRSHGTHPIGTVPSSRPD